MRNKRIYPCPGRYYLHINDSEITIILGLIYQSYTIGLTHKHTAVLNYWTKQTVWRNNVIHILLEVHSGRFCGTCFDFIWGTRLILWDTNQLRKIRNCHSHADQKSKAEVSHGSAGTFPEYRYFLLLMAFFIFICLSFTG